VPRDIVVDGDDFSVQGRVGGCIVHTGRHDLTIRCPHDHCAERKKGIGARRRDRQMHRLLMDGKRNRGQLERLRRYRAGGQAGAAGDRADRQAQCPSRPHDDLSEPLTTGDPPVAIAGDRALLT
jgi:hypothetical protein